MVSVKTNPIPKDKSSSGTEIIMATHHDDRLIEDPVGQPEFQIVGEISTLETRIQLLEEENARLQESLHFILEMYCCDE